jgi:hypothetical protein
MNECLKAAGNCPMVNSQPQAAFRKPFYSVASCFQKAFMIMPVAFRKIGMSSFSLIHDLKQENI